MTHKLIKTVLAFSFIFFSLTSYSQISYGGSPMFKYGSTKMELETVRLPHYEIMSTIEALNDQAEDSKLKHAQYAHKYNVAYGIRRNGVWENLNDGRRVWRFSITSEGAYSLGLMLSKFKLPRGGQFFVYNKYSDRVLGSYTEKNNKESGRFSIEPLAGDQLILEYLEPLGAEFEAEIEIGSVLHDYKNIFNLLRGNSSRLKLSGSCNVNINCPEGDLWQLEKRSVCHILYGGWIASGALINNTSFDGTPYILTAHHAIDEQDEAQTAIFYFNYEDSACELNDGKRTQSISGSNLVATSNNLDFTLLTLSVEPPAGYNPYYAGWDRSNRVPAKTVSIHHPSGDAKKISLDNDAPLTGTYSDSRFTFDDNTHWNIVNWEVGTTEGGSSGSPLFDENHRIIGDLTGGDANCEEPVNDFYAKFSASWDNYQNANQQLKHWLDPLNLGVETLEGLDPYFELSAESRCVGNEFTVKSKEDDEIQNIEWNFGEDAVPTSATGIGPHTFRYNSAGNKTITLSYILDGKEVVLHRVVRAINLDNLDFTYQVTKNQVQMQNTSIDFDRFAWNFGDEGTSNDVNPVHKYNATNKYTVSLTGENDCGDRTINKEVELVYNNQLKIYPNPSKGNFVVDLSRIAFEEIKWEVFSAKGALVRNGIVSKFSSTLNFSLEGFNAGVYFLKLDVDGEMLRRKLLLVK